MPATVLKSKESSGMSAFLKKGDPQNLSDLKQKYFSPNQKGSFKRPEDQISHWSDVERYIDRTKRSRKLQESMQLRSRFNKLMKDWFMIQIEGKSVFVWHSKRLQEVLLMHVPRFIFLTGSIYTIYCMRV